MGKIFIHCFNIDLYKNWKINKLEMCSAFCNKYFSDVLYTILSGKVSSIQYIKILRMSLEGDINPLQLCLHQVSN